MHGCERTPAIGLSTAFPAFDKEDNGRKYGQYAFGVRGTRRERGPATGRTSPPIATPGPLAFCAHAPACVPPLAWASEGRVKGRA